MTRIFNFKFLIFNLAILLFSFILYSLFTIHFAKPAYADEISANVATEEQAKNFSCPTNHPHSKTYSYNASNNLWSVTCYDDVIGTITPPDTIPVVQNAEGDPSTFIAGLVRASLNLLLIVAFIIALLWTIFAGYRFIFAGGEPKNVTAAWSQIYWGLLGMAVVLGAYAIIRLAEAFFGVNIVSGGFQLPQR